MLYFWCCVGTVLSCLAFYVPPSGSPSSCSIFYASPPVTFSSPPRAGNSFSCNTCGSPRKYCKEKTYGEANPFKCNTYKKPGWGPAFTMLAPSFEGRVFGERNPSSHFFPLFASSFFLSPSYGFRLFEFATFKPSNVFGLPAAPTVPLSPNVQTFFVSPGGHPADCRP
jgi:hypothetical protein